MDDPLSPSLLQVSIKQSKTDPFSKGYLSIGRMGTKLCQVAALLDFIASSGTAPGPLFTFQDGPFQSCPIFVELVRDALVRVGFDQRQYCGHNFRKGVAITAAKKGL